MVGISQTCYRYVCKRITENDQIADRLMRLTDNHRSWRFGLCYTGANICAKLRATHGITSGSTVSTGIWSCIFGRARSDNQIYFMHIKMCCCGQYMEAGRDM